MYNGELMEQIVKCIKRGVIIFTYRIIHVFVILNVLHVKEEYEKYTLFLQILFDIGFVKTKKSTRSTLVLL